MLWRALAVVAFAAAPAQAVTLVTGTNALGGTSFAAEPNLGGVVQEDVSDDFSVFGDSGTLSASVQSRVLLSNDGTYDFYWRITNIAFEPSGVGGDAITIGALRIGNFGATVLGYNANFRTDGVGDRGPNSAFVFNPDTNFVNFNFSDALAAGETSAFMFLDTDATSYARNALLDLSTTGSNPISNLRTTFGVSAVPEPSTWAMMLIGFGAVSIAARRRSGGHVQAAIA